MQVDELKQEQQSPLPKNPTDVIEPIKLLNKSKYEVYLAKSPQSSKLYAMKFFPHENGKVNVSYLSERCLLGLKHPNLIQIRASKDLQDVRKNGQNILNGVIIMEYAPYGDFDRLVRPLSDL
mmetsp:Transcript_18684/g.16233  ORF Transcript_18684/g.16233 Transcript_18684/m.16233 type:complete len:122 (+) Transcript_18684:54-419(+)